MNTIGRRIYKTILISYLLLLAVPVMIGLIVYPAYINKAEQFLFRNNLSILQQARDVLDTVYEEVFRLSAHISVDQNIQYFRQAEDLVEIPVMSRAISYIREEGLVPMALSSPFISWYGFLFFDSDIIIGPRFISSYKNNYQSIAHFADMDYPTMIADLRSMGYRHHFSPAVKVRLFLKEGEHILYRHNPSGPMAQAGIILILLDTLRIQEMLNRIALHDGGMVILVDGDGNILTGIQNNIRHFSVVPSDFESTIKELEGEGDVFVKTSKTLITQTRLPLSGWRIIAFQSDTYIRDQVRGIWILTSVTSGFFLLLGIMAAFFLSIRAGKPLVSLVEAADIQINQISKRRFFFPLEKAIDSFLLRQETLNTTIKEQRQYITDLKVRSIINGFIPAPDELKSLLEEIDIHRGKAFYAVISIRVDENPILGQMDKFIESETRTMTIRKILRQFREIKKYVIQDSTDSFLLLCSWDNPGEDPRQEQIKNTFVAFEKNLCEVHMINTRIAMGNSYPSPSWLKQSFEDTLIIQERCKTLPYGVYTLDDVEAAGYSSPAIFFFPEELARKMIASGLAGHFEDICHDLDLLYSENFRGKYIDKNMERILLNSLLAILLKIAGESAFLGREFINRIAAVDLSPGQAEKNFQTLRELAAELCASINKKQNNHNHILKEKLGDYLVEFYSDSGLCITSISQRFKISELYFSRFFKEQFGINFQEYLEDLRMTKAVELLKNPELRIKDIYSLVGYSSMNSFGRAFRRRYGLSPTEYQRGSYI